MISGKYKVPLARGIVRPSFHLHSRLERYLSSDIDNWLGNLLAARCIWILCRINCCDDFSYFEVSKLPRYVSGQKEYEVELQYTSGLLGLNVLLFVLWSTIVKFKNLFLLALRLGYPERPNQGDNALRDMSAEAANVLSRTFVIPLDSCCFN